jgi:hypothetical protein
MSATLLTSELAIGAMGSLIASIIAGISVYMYKVGLLSECYQCLLSYSFRPTFASLSDRQISPQKITSVLLHRLRWGQTLWPWNIHYGQFGRNGNSDRFLGAKEAASIKPRMYLTSWPAIVMARRGLSPRNVVWATKGVLRLLVRHGDYRVHVSQSVGIGRPPRDEPRMVSFRHTMCGAWLLHSIQGWNPISREIVDSMIDVRNGWQNKDGGWALCDHEYTASDLWASAYAAQLLDKVLSDDVLAGGQRSLARDALASTLEYFKVSWHKKRWTLQASQSEENAVLMLADLGPLLLVHDRTFLQDVVSHIVTWLSPAGYLSDQYVSKLLVNRDLSTSVLYARMSYALYRAGENVSLWEPLYRKAIALLDDKLNSAELAFLLDLTYVLGDATSPQPSPTMVVKLEEARPPT